MHQPGLTVYGHPRCPQVIPVRQFLDRAAVPYTYINIRDDAAARSRVMALNAGNKTVPTLVFADGTILREPHVWQVHAQLGAAGVHVPSFVAFSIQHSLMIVLVAFLLMGMVAGKVLGSAVLGSVVGLIVGLLVNARRIRRAGS
ncbi:MAG TPA: glutaredoxin family protein [Herpetosiphonaceae bacterium]